MYARIKMEQESKLVTGGVSLDKLPINLTEEEVSLQVDVSKELASTLVITMFLFCLYAQSMIDIIKERTDKYKDVNGKIGLKKHSESYTQIRDL